MNYLVKRCFVVLALAGACGGEPVRLGGQASGFDLQDLNGKTLGVPAPRGGITVVTFFSTQCPISNAYTDRMNSVYRDYVGKGVQFFFVDANRTETLAEMADHAKSVGFLFPLYKDPENRLADRLDAQVTPESFVINREGVLVYRGQIDDSRNPARIQKNSLRLALEAALANRPVAVAETKAFGCTIKRVRKTL